MTGAEGSHVHMYPATNLNIVPGYNPITHELYSRLEQGAASSTAQTSCHSAGSTTGPPVPKTEETSGKQGCARILPNPLGEWICDGVFSLTNGNLDQPCYSLHTIPNTTLLLSSALQAKNSVNSTEYTRTGDSTKLPQPLAIWCVVCVSTADA